MKLWNIKLGQKGIAEWIVLAILAAAIPATLYLVQNTQVFKSRAFDSQGNSVFAYLTSPTPTSSSLVAGVPVPLHAHAISGNAGLIYLAMFLLPNGADLSSQWQAMDGTYCPGGGPNIQCDLNINWTPPLPPSGSTGWIVAVVGFSGRDDQTGSCSGNPNTQLLKAGWYPCGGQGQADHANYIIVPPGGGGGGGQQCPPVNTCYAPIAGCAPAQGCGQQTAPTVAPTVLPTTGGSGSLWYCNPSTHQCASAGAACPLGQVCGPDQNACNQACAPSSPTATPVPSQITLLPSSFNLGSPTVSCDDTTHTPKVVITWSQSNYAAHYVAGRIKNPLLTATGATSPYDATSPELPSSITSLTDTLNLLSNTGYTYRVLAYNPFGSIFSNDQVIQTPSCSVQTPTNTPTPTLTQVAVTATCSVAPTTATTGQSVTWRVSASGGNSTYSYSWTGDEGLNLINVGSTSFVWNYSTAGSKTARVKVTDSAGNTSDWKDCSNSVSVSSTAVTPTATTGPTPTNGPSCNRSNGVIKNADGSVPNRVASINDFAEWKIEYVQEKNGLPSSRRADFNCRSGPTQDNLQVGLDDFNIWWANRPNY